MNTPYAPWIDYLTTALAFVFVAFVVWRATREE